MAHQIFEEKSSMKIEFLLLFTSAEAQTALLRNASYRATLESNQDFRCQMVKEQEEKQDQMGMKKKVCPPTLCTAKLAPAADDGLLLVLVGRSKYCSANFYGWSLFHFTPHSIKGFSCALNLNYVAFLNPNCNFKLRTSNLHKYLYDRSYVRRKFQLGSYFVI